MRIFTSYKSVTTFLQEMSTDNFECGICSVTEDTTHILKDDSAKLGVQRNMVLFVEIQTVERLDHPKKPESLFGFFYSWFVSEPSVDKPNKVKEKYKETLEHLEIRTPSWPLFVEQEEYMNDPLTQQKITIEKQIQEIFEKEPEKTTLFRWSPSSSLRKGKSAENSPPMMTYFTKKSKVSP